jgi:hypothetical protein
MSTFLWLEAGEVGAAAAADRIGLVVSTGGQPTSS